MAYEIEKSDSEWRACLTREQYAIARRGATERAFTGVYHHHDADGVYGCVCCRVPLFDSVAKFDSGSGWPSFWTTIVDRRIERREDLSHGMVRLEARCARCGAHLGHVFEDGPKPTGLRFCINSASLTFLPRAAAPRFASPGDPEPPAIAGSDSAAPGPEIPPEPRS